MTDRTPDTVPELLVERFRRGELSATRADEVRTRLAGEPDRLSALEADDAVIFAQYPVARTVREIEARRAEADWHRRRTWRRGLLMLPVVAAMLILLRPPPVEYTGIKGDHTLFIHRVEGHDAVRLPPGAVANEHDRLQLSYLVDAEDRWGVVASLDGRGVATLHLPDGGARAEHLAVGGTIPLSQSYELDDAPRFERFFLVTATTPFDVRDVEDALHELAGQEDGGMTGDLPIDQAYSVTDVFVEKGPT